MKHESFAEHVSDLYHIVSDAPKRLRAHELNEEWTKQNLILPTLAKLGWDPAWEIHPESHPDGTEGSIDYLCKPQAAGSSSLCIEAKALMVTPPAKCEHPQTVKGLEQTKHRGASHFVWTNGDSWQFFALAVPGAPICEVTISATRGDEEQIAEVAKRLQVLDKEEFLSNPRAIDSTILATCKAIALPAAFRALLTELDEELLHFIKGALPRNLEISRDEILEFLRTCELIMPDVRQTSTSRLQTQKIRPSPEEWENLVSSPDPKYLKAKVTLLRNERRRLGEYLVGEKYKPCRATTTYSIIGYAKRGKETKGITGQVVTLYRKWGFIKPQDPSESNPDRIMYERVEDAVDYLRRFLQS